MEGPAPARRALVAEVAGVGPMWLVVFDGRPDGDEVEEAARLGVPLTFAGWSRRRRRVIAAMVEQMDGGAPARW